VAPQGKNFGGKEGKEKTKSASAGSEGKWRREWKPRKRQFSRCEPSLRISMRNTCIRQQCFLQTNWFHCQVRRKKKKTVDQLLHSPLFVFILQVLSCCSIRRGRRYLPPCQQLLPVETISTRETSFTTNSTHEKKAALSVFGVKVCGTLLSLFPFFFAVVADNQFRPS
jgi:hypothetical protein